MWFAVILLGLCAGSAAGQSAPRTGRAAVSLEGKTIFYLYARVGSILPTERAKVVSERLAETARNRRISPEAVAVQDAASASDIVAGETIIVTITDADAAPLGLNRRALAERYAENIRKTIVAYRKARGAGAIARGVATSLLATIVLVLALRLLAWSGARVRRGMHAAASRFARPLRIQHVELLSPEHVAALLVRVYGVIHAGIVLAVFYVYLTVVFAAFPWTEGYASTLIGALTRQLQGAWDAFLRELPNILFVSVIILITKFVLRAIRFFFDGVGEGSLSLPGFDREWAAPTYKLVRVLVLALALVAAFPYIPGSSSAAFQGVGVFLGLIFSLGSGSSVANMVAGIVLTYMQPFRVGDRVKVADTVGDVVEKTLLVTRIRTPKNVEVTIPNSLVLGAHIVNFSAHARGDGLIIHTTVTIGYDAPWRTVHELLKQAALRTTGILPDPEPFVLQTALQDHYVAYELNAFTREPQSMSRLYSDLHQNIQDAFNEAGVEIMSPHYAALRDGNATTIPPDYLPQTYEAPAFRIHQEQKEG